MPEVTDRVPPEIVPALAALSAAFPPERADAMRRQLLRFCNEDLAGAMADEPREAKCAFCERPENAGTCWVGWSEAGGGFELVIPEGWEGEEEAPGSMPFMVCEECVRAWSGVFEEKERTGRWPPPLDLIQAEVARAVIDEALRETALAWITRASGVTHPREPASTRQCAHCGAGRDEAVTGGRMEMCGECFRSASKALSGFFRPRVHRR